MSKGNTIGDRIRQLRERKNETQAELAKALNVKRETVNQWENGTRDLKTQYTILLAQHFGTTCDYILRGVEAPNVSVHEKIGLAEETIKILERKKQKYLFSYVDKDKAKEFDWGTDKNKILDNVEKIGGKDVQFIHVKNYIETIDLLVQDPSDILEDISSFLFAEFYIDGTKINDTFWPSNGSVIPVKMKGQDTPELIKKSQINEVYLLKAQAKLIDLKKKISKESE